MLNRSISSNTNLIRRSTNHLRLRRRTGSRKTSKVMIVGIVAAVLIVGALLAYNSQAR